MKNKKITIVFVMIISIALVSAVVINIDRGVSVSSRQLTTLQELNLAEYDVTDYSLGTEEVQRCLNKISCAEEFDEDINETINVCKNVINTCKTFQTFHSNCLEIQEEICVNWEKVYFTEGEMVDILDTWEEERIGQIADVKRDRDIRTKEKIREGETTIN